MRRGFFAIGIYHTKTEANVGTLLRSAYLYDAAFVFTVGHRYKAQCSDTPKTPNQIPLFHFSDMDDLIEHLPHSTPLVGVELDSRSQELGSFGHPDRCAYLLGAEDHGLPPTVLERCHSLLRIDTPRPQSMNVSAAGSIVLYDRYQKTQLAPRKGGE